jgi:hypothetical protein
VGAPAAKHFEPIYLQQLQIEQSDLRDNADVEAGEFARTKK